MKIYNAVNVVGYINWECTCREFTTCLNFLMKRALAIQPIHTELLSYAEKLNNEDPL